MMTMPKDQPDEQYTPNGHKIPIPTRGEFEANLDKLVKAPPPPARYRKPRSASRAGSSGKE